MRESRIKMLLRGALCAGLAWCPLLAADLTASQSAADSSAGGFYALVLGLMATLFGGMAFCFGLVKLAEKVVHGFQSRHAAPVPVSPVRHAA
ncbi:MAG TPA: hypothetical protein VLN48_10890 [Bryobacteraceae bacterium]|nr:hypothetical protein [Bryobacteraceae bacterium]